MRTPISIKVQVSREEFCIANFFLFFLSKSVLRDSLIDRAGLVISIEGQTIS